MEIRDEQSKINLQSEEVSEILELEEGPSEITQDKEIVGSVSVTLEETSIIT